MQIFSTAYLRPSYSHLQITDDRKQAAEKLSERTHRIRWPSIIRHFRRQVVQVCIFGCNFYGLTASKLFLPHVNTIAYDVQQQVNAIAYDHKFISFLHLKISNVAVCACFFVFSISVFTQFPFRREILKQIYRDQDRLLVVRIQL